jgi:cell division transport system permease protein
MLVVAVNYLVINMAQFGKKTSTNRGKPSYFMSILGVTLVLFFLGLVGFLMINARQLGKHFRESVEVQAYVKDGTPLNTIDSIRGYLDQQAFVKRTDYITKEAAKQIYLSDDRVTEEQFKERLDEVNPLPASVNFKMNSKYVTVDTLEKIKNYLYNTYPGIIEEVRYPKTVVEKMDRYIRQGIIGLLAIAFILGFLVILLIDNTIKLAMFSSRFIIKTMQMVGATRFFISQPFDKRAIINGSISGMLASILVYIFIYVIENMFLDGELKKLGYSSYLWIIFVSLVIFGILITLYSTHKSVLKYLKMKLDDLY